MRKTLTSRPDDRQYVLDALGDFENILSKIDPEQFHELQDALAGSIADLATFVAEHL
jgi:hypothetical protein